VWREGEALAAAAAAASHLDRLDGVLDLEQAALRGERVHTTVILTPAKGAAGCVSLQAMMALR
jgi:hypothetical protein